MKTPRQLLLERHADRTPRLDALRSATLARLETARRSVESAPRRALAWWEVAWHELFWSVRRTWAGLGTLALLALGLNLGAGRESVGRPSDPEPGRAVLAEVVRERAALLADLTETPAAPSPSTAPAPLPALPGSVPGQRRSSLDHSAWVA